MEKQPNKNFLGEIPSKLSLKVVKKGKAMSKKAGNSAKILGIKLAGTPEELLLERIEGKIKKRKKIFVVTSNPEFLVFARHNFWFKKILNQADLAIPDGVGLIWAKEVVGKKNFFLRLIRGFWVGLKVVFAGWGKKRVGGVDFMEKLCALARKKNWSVYLIGGEPGVAKKALEVLKKRYPGLRGWAETGPRITNHQLPITDCQLWIERINQKKPNFLFVAFGMGKQEKFIADNWEKLNVGLAMGVGGAFDYISGKISRAPEWMRSLGLEWFYRLLRQPRRLKRQLRLVEFVFLVLSK